MYAVMLPALMVAVAGDVKLYGLLPMVTTHGVVELADVNTVKIVELVRVTPQLRDAGSLEPAPLIAVQVFDAVHRFRLLPAVASVSNHSSPVAHVAGAAVCV
jgi:hypothetical protein